VELTRLHAGDRVLIHAAAGGVGTALVQIAKMHGCTVFGTTGTQSKMSHLRKLGVDYPLCTSEADFAEEYRRIAGQTPLDVIYDPLGGSTVRKGLHLLGSGGRLVCYGASNMVAPTPNLPHSLRTVLSFGFPHPVVLLLHSKSLIGINLLRIADDHPEIIRRCIDEVLPRAIRGELCPVVGRVFPVSELALAHEFLRNRSSVGKVALRW
jgi:NADPH2:quinone reductase